MPSSSFSYSSSWAVPAEQQRNSIGITVESHVYISSETAAGRHRNSSGPAADQQWNITSRLSAEQQRNISGSASAQQRTNIGTAVEPQWSSNSQPSTVAARLVCSRLRCRCRRRCHRLIAYRRRGRLCRSSSLFVVAVVRFIVFVGVVVVVIVHRAIE